MSQQPADLGTMLLSSGAVQGPYRRARPITLTLWQRIRRALRALLIDRKGPTL